MLFRSLSIKQKLIAMLIFAVLAATIASGTIQQWIARDLIKSNMENIELKSMLQQVGNRVDGEVSLMKSAAFSVANDPDIIAWSAAGANHAGEQRLLTYLGQLADHNKFTVISFADRQSYKYWNQEGFLRILQHDDYDSWFFAYLDSGKAESLSIYNEPGIGYRMFANYQQLHGRGMSGVAKSVDELIDILNRTSIADTGYLFMVDASGTINVHQNTDYLGQATLADIYSQDIADKLLQKQPYNLTRGNIQGKDILFASTYVKSAGWYLVAQVPENELYTAMNDASWQMAVWSLIIAALFGLLGVWFAGSIAQPIEKLASIFTRLGNGQGDLRLRLEAPEQREINDLVQGFNQFIARLHDIISQVAQTSEQLRRSASNVAEQSMHTEESSQQQHDRTLQVASALSQMGNTVNEIAQSAQTTAEHATTSASTTSSGQHLTQNAVSAINHLHQQIGDVTNIVSSLDAHTTEITGILDAIRSISEQTNLLALNAAIEAARAGDHGRGFSVVADEVRGLAQRAASATDDIQRKLDDFKIDSKRAVDAMQQSNHDTGNVVTSAQAIQSVLDDIAAGVEQISDMNTQIATATEEQTLVVSDINKNIGHISTASDANLQTAQELVAVSKQLDKLAEDLALNVKRFTL
jgi:methyl-accepting chemotaxis protein